MNIHELHATAKRAFEGSGDSQKDVGDLIGVDRSAVSRAVRNVGLKHAAVQARIISALRNVTVQRRSTFNGATVSHEWVVDP